VQRESLFMLEMDNFDADDADATNNNSINEIK
jgi:hypothetical protein